MAKKKHKREKKPPNKMERSLNSLAWQFARVMGQLPRRKGQGDMIINHLGEVGCIPIGGSQSDYFYCKGCFNEGICSREGSGKEVKWRLRENGSVVAWDPRN